MSQCPVLCVMLVSCAVCHVTMSCPVCHVSVLCCVSCHNVLSCVSCQCPVLQVMENSWKPLADAPILEKAQFINFNAVECGIPAHNQSYIIKVTNDGVALSAGLLFIPFDSRCNNCSTNYKRCTKKVGVGVTISASLVCVTHHICLPISRYICVTTSV